MLARSTSSSKARPDTAHTRALVVSLALACWMLAIGARLVYLQTSQHDMLQGKARAQQQDVVETSALRGLVLDRAGHELARSILTESFFVVPGEIKSVEETVAQLSKVLGTDEKERAALVKRLHEAQETNRKFAWVARKLEYDDAEKLRQLNLEGLYSLKEPKRFYPNGLLASHVLGFVGLDEMGLAGIEQAYNERIKGEPGKVLVERDAHLHPYGSLEAEARQGQTIVLTLDQMVQYRTEQALRTAVENAHAKSGTAIVLDPHTGEILALANAPSFDPNNPNTVSKETLANGALQNIYEPGSTFKIVAYSAAIEKGLVKPEDKIDCQMGSITVAGRLIHDHHPFGTLTIADALAKSSNVAAIKLGLRVGDDSMYDYIRRFGFGSQTRIELPGETLGLVRKVSNWQPSSIGSIAIGQEVGVTPVQMVAAFGALANDGLRIAPHIVKEVRTLDGKITYQAAPEQHQVVKAETAKALRGMLEGVTLNGTAKKAQLDGYTAAGKTGTAQKIDPQTHTYSKTKYIGSFVGFAPVENPAVVIIVVIDEPKGSYHGGDVAAPVFREIAEQVLPDLNVAPDTELKDAPMHQQIALSPRAAEAMESAHAELQREAEERDATLPQVARKEDRGGMEEVVYAPATRRAVLMPNLRGRSVRDAVNICAALGLQLEAQGDGGRALRQRPEAGAEVHAGQVVDVDFGRKD
jgi:cell division protein FtsI (penicillin-binding protein 3)